MSASGNNKAMGMVTVDVEENKSSVALDGSVEISLEDKKVSVPVHQAGKQVTPIEGAKWWFRRVQTGLEWWFNEGSGLNSTDWRHEVQKSGWVNNELQNYVNGSADGKRVTEIAEPALHPTVSRAATARFIRGAYMLTKPRAGFTVSSRLASNCLKVKAHGLLSGWCLATMISEQILGLNVARLILWKR